MESATIRLLRLIFKEYQRDSWRELNVELSRALSLSINLRFEIRPGDWGIIVSDFRYHYWAAKSDNGHHLGEEHYALAAREHRPAAIEYERLYGRLKFILNGRRLHVGSYIFIGNRRWRLTGWTADNQSITLVSYDDWRETAGQRRKTINADEWKSLRKEASHAP